MNAKNKVIIAFGAIILFIVITVSYVFANKLKGNDGPTIEEQCRAGSIDACKSVILEKQKQYGELEKQMQAISSGANEAREIMKEQLSGTFL